MNCSVPAKINYVAEVNNVREVTLLANADLSYWEDRLMDERFQIYSDNVKAELMISSADLVWKGMRSQEVSISIRVHSENEDNSIGYFLIHAFNSSRLFAFIERNIFHTPYYYGNIDVSVERPLVVVRDKEQELLMLHLPENRLPEQVEIRQWQGPVFLPSSKRKNVNGKLFFAKIGGRTEVYRYQPSSDLIRLHGSEHRTVIRMLRESGLTGKEWQVRKNAAHAKSKTYVRN